jgi:NADH dehydrogenase
MIKQQVLIVGGGFAGVKTALELSGDEHFNVTLLTDHEGFRYYPSLYHTATGGKRASSAVSYSDIFEGKGLTVIIASAKTLDRKAKLVMTEDGASYPYDYLVLALGVVTNYFSIPGLAELSYSIKTNEDAVKFKRHLHAQLIDEKKPDLNYLIVGAGPTGIELAGMLPHYLKTMMQHHGIKDRQVHVRLIEAAPRLLPRMPKATSRYVKWRLKRLGVQVLLGRVVQGQTADSLLVNGKPIKSHTVVWTAGVTNHPFFSENHFVLMPRGKVATDVYLQAEENIFVQGDNANTPYSGLAQTAVRDGAFVGHNLKRLADGKTMKPYKPRAPISVIPAGKNWAVVIYKDLQIHGYLGWLLRSAADFIAFKDIESWPKAAHQWAEEIGDQEDCPYCREATLPSHQPSGHVDFISY